MTNPGWKLLFLTSWGRFSGRFENICEDLDRHEQLIDKEANAHSIAEAQRMRQELRDWKDQSLSQIARVEAEGVENRYNSILAWLKVDESDQLSIFDSISSEGDKYPGTCTWALKNKKISKAQVSPCFGYKAMLDLGRVFWLRNSSNSFDLPICLRFVTYVPIPTPLRVCTRKSFDHYCSRYYAGTMSSSRTFTMSMYWGRNPLPYLRLKGFCKHSWSTMERVCNVLTTSGLPSMV